MNKRRNFEKFNEFMNDNFPRASLVEKAIAECVWDKRQVEIEAIKCLNRNYSKLIDEQSELKPYGWGIVDKDGDYAGARYNKEMAEEDARNYSKWRTNKAPYRVVQLFYKDES